MLRPEIDAAKQTVTTDSVGISIGEVSSMYAGGELNILPEFQRLFRWTMDRKSSFIESILIGIPIPPAFVYENEDGTWELIDGLQRISTVLEFMGVLKNPENQEFMRSKLVSTKYLPSLENTVWNVQADGEVPLETALQLFFRRHRIEFQILKHPSDSRTKFDLFQRLNRGGAYANEQEVRTCSMVLANADATRELRNLCATEEYLQLFRISPDQKAVQRDIEYAVRMIAHSHADLPRGMDVQQYLDQAIVEVFAGPDALEAIEDVRWVTHVLSTSLGAIALIPPEDRHEGIAPRFSLRALEGIAVGLIRNRAKIQALPDPNQFVIDRVASFWLQPEVAEMSAAGLRGTVRISRSIPFGTIWFDSDVDH